MNIESFIARRVALSGEKSFSRLIVRIAVVAVALSLAVMIVAIAMISGFKRDISSKIFGFWGHIHITDTDINRNLLDAKPVQARPDFYATIDTLGPVSFEFQGEAFGQPVVQTLKTRGGVRHIQSYALKPGIVKAGQDMEGIILKGVGQDFDWSFMEQYLVEGRTLNVKGAEPSSEILISQQTADRLQLGVGDRLTGHFVQQGDQLRRRFEVVGLYKTGLEEFDQKFAMVDIRQVQQLLGWSEDEVGGFEVFVEYLEDLQPLTNYIYYEKLPNDFYAETIRENLPEIFDWLDLQDINEVVILVLMVIVAIINMVTALMILILERTTMIGTLKALGSTNWSIRKIFLYHAAYIIGVGLFWGNLIGLGICLVQERFGLIRLDEANYYLSVAPIHLQFWPVLLLNIGTLLVTLIFLIVPSYLVTSISPVKAIRFN